MGCSGVGSGGVEWGGVGWSGVGCICVTIGVGLGVILAYIAVGNIVSSYMLF